MHLHLFVAPIHAAGVILLEGNEQTGEIEDWLKLYLVNSKVERLGSSEGSPCL
jgi:hypothetical protein